jgi:hypothetical protein
VALKEMPTLPSFVTQVITPCACRCPHDLIFMEWDGIERLPLILLNPTVALFRSDLNKHDVLNSMHTANKVISDHLFGSIRKQTNDEQWR